MILETNTDLGRTLIVFVQDIYGNLVNFPAEKLDLSLVHP